VGGTELLKTSSMPKGGAKTGIPLDFLQDVARDNNLYFTMTSGKNSFANELSFMSFDKVDNSNFLKTYSLPISEGSNVTPTAGVDYSIIGTPIQNDNGLALRVLLDPGLQILAPNAQTFAISGAVVKQSPANFGGASGSFPLLTKDGNYCVGGVRHVLDSRGNEWYSEIYGVLSGDQKAQLMGLNVADPNSGSVNSKLAGGVQNAN
jgi:hypothetical protein